MGGFPGLILLLAGVLASGIALAGDEPSIDDPDPDARFRAVGRLATTPGPRAHALLIRALADEHLAVRDRAVHALASRDCPAETTRLARLVGRARPVVVREGLARVLGRRPGEGGVAALIDRLDDPAPTVRTVAARGLGVVGTAAAIPALRVRLGDRRPGPRREALLSLDALDPAGSAARAVDALADVDPDIRVAAVLLLERRWGEVADQALVRSLRDRSWSVRTAAARAVARVRLAAAVPELIRGLEAGAGRVREEVHEALGSLTGLGLPDDPARWREWWARTGEGFRPPELAVRPRLERHTSIVTYHTIPVTSRSVVFVIDASRSMREPLGGPEGPTRRESALAELEGTLRRLPRGTRFNIVLFGREIHRWQPVARPVGPAAVAAALKMARRVPAGGGSDLHAALSLALEDRGSDTVYLLGDGAPGGGRYRGRAALRDALIELNRFRLVRIHTVGYGADRVARRWRGFLADLAADHGGIHVSR